MLKRILCIFLSITIIFSVCTLSVSANVMEVPDNFDYFLSNFRSYYEDYKSGNSTWGEFIEKTLAETRKLGLNNQTAINGYKDLIALLESLGIDVDDFWTDFYYQRNGGSVDDSSLKGMGALAVIKYKESYRNSYSSFDFYYYGEYGVVDVNDSGTWCYIYNGYYDNYSVMTGKLHQSNMTFSGGKQCYSPNDVEYRTLELYGDWRYADGTPAIDNITEFPDKVVPPYDDDSIPEDDLIDFLEDLLNKLALQFPDLSTVEGLLAAILAKLDTLDSDDDAVLLGQINAAIISLANNTQAGNEQLITTLNDLKESISGGSSTDVSQIVEQLKGLQKSLDYLCTVSTLDMGIEAWDKLTENESKFLNEYAKLITAILPKFGFTTVNNMLNSLNSVVLNTNAPAPLTANIWGEPVVILSTDTFAGSEQYISLAKTFISVLLVYSFCLMFRKKVVSGGD